MEATRLRSSRLLRFTLVGIFNTSLDFALYNTLIFTLHSPRYVANIISTSIAMTVSYLLNHSFVFRQKGPRNWRTFLAFLVITAAGLYGLQSVVIYIFTTLLKEPTYTIYIVVVMLFKNRFSEDFISFNFAKALASTASMIWNYILYKRFIFKKR